MKAHPGGDRGPTKSDRRDTTRTAADPLRSKPAPGRGTDQSVVPEVDVPVVRRDYRIVSVDLPNGRVVAGTLVQNGFLELRDPRLDVKVDDVVLVDGREAKVTGFTRREHRHPSEGWPGRDGLWMQLEWGEG